MTQERLQKVLARSGIGSRRSCESLITAGRVAVDGRTVTELGTRVDPFVQQVTLDGQRVRTERRLTLVVNKPRGVLCTNAAETRPRVIDLVPFVAQRLYTVGRLDLDSDGLVLVTNDGLLAQVLTHPRHEVTKTYVAEVEGKVTQQALARVRGGVHLAEGSTGGAEVRVVGRSGPRTRLNVTIRRGLNRQVRRMLARAGLKVRRLTRIAIGPVHLGRLKPGASRPLSPTEQRAIERLLERAREDGPSRPRRGRR